ncbi:class I histocompatibility antigen, F10 alpha chain-like [Onychostruthus taczanowskii]|uniref:class I histocompatibility antigen, F10 alpha chain-like n=1 Tax=Onychostruthus taczanowskii TaxID=356909 RepID=UPI001B80D883|nr:class I histocompatibility antigen, F10 alpha chain-like [Onychostruthus taczanowskii]
MAPALGLGVLLGLLALLGDPGCATKVPHSLRYLYVAVSEPSPGVPQFMITGFGCGSMGLGLHAWLRLYGCDLLSDGSVRGSERHSYDGQDFISFDLASGRFVAADSGAEVTRRRWEQEEVAEGFTNYLGHECPEWLQKYVGYGQKELERKVRPDVHVSGKEEHGMLILSCHAYGFYPKTIVVSWMKGNDTLDQGPEWGGIVPNSDGTFHTWARIEALPEKWEQYRCRVEHPGMLEPGIFAWERTSGGNLTVLVAVCVIAAILIVLIGFGVWRLQSGRRDGKGYNPAAGKDVGTNGLSTGITTA